MLLFFSFVFEEVEDVLLFGKRDMLDYEFWSSKQPTSHVRLIIKKQQLLRFCYALIIAVFVQITTVLQVDWSINHIQRT